MRKSETMKFCFNDFLGLVIKVRRKTGCGGVLKEFIGNYFISQRGNCGISA